MFGLILSVCNAVAIEIDDLYRSDILVSSQSASDRRAAIKDGLQQVLVKVSGNSKILQDASITNSIKHASDLLQKYEYSLYENDFNEEQIQIHLEFDPQGVNRLLKQANQSIWGRNRPFVIAWVIDEDAQPASQSVTDIKLQRLLAHNLDQRGIPLIQPILDLQELDQIDRLKRGYADWNYLQDISKRYGSDITLIIKLTPMGGHDWRSQWSLLLGEHWQNWDLKGPDLAVLFHQGVDLLGDALAGQYQNQADKDNKLVTLVINNVDSVSNYIKINQYLTGLSSIQQVRVVSVYSDTITYELVIDASEQSLVQTFASGQLLASVGHGLTYSNILHYRLAS